MKLFDTAIYVARRKALMQAMGNGILFFPGAAEQPMNYKANVFPFRQDSNFLYYFEFSNPAWMASSMQITELLFWWAYADIGSHMDGATTMGTDSIDRG
jgi:hypothetical protein